MLFPSESESDLVLPRLPANVTLRVVLVGESDFDFPPKPNDSSTNWEAATRRRNKSTTKRILKMKTSKPGCHCQRHEVFRRRQPGLGKVAERASAARRKLARPAGREGRKGKEGRERKRKRKREERKKEKGEERKKGRKKRREKKEKERKEK